jgi:hypothetical protein
MAARRVARAQSREGFYALLKIAADGPSAAAATATAPTRTRTAAAAWLSLDKFRVGNHNRGAADYYYLDWTWLTSCCHPWGDSGYLLAAGDLGGVAGLESAERLARRIRRHRRLRGSTVLLQIRVDQDGGEID